MVDTSRDGRRRSGLDHLELKDAQLRGVAAALAGISRREAPNLIIG